jgi:hypothetical protein
LGSALYIAGVESEEVNGFTWNGKTFKKGTVVIRRDQPYGAFAKAILEPQEYPHLVDENGQPTPPYDVTAHSLSLLTNTPVTKADVPFKMPKPMGLIPADKDFALTIGTFTPSKKHVLLYRSSMPSMDEGWTRWIFENSGDLVPSPCG